MNTPAISIIIPVYNAQRYLKKCIESVRQQNIDNIEIICVDDGSSDNSLSILREYEKLDKRIHVFTQKNSFAGVARNHGMQEAHGEYYAFLDADDYFKKDSLNKLYNLAKKYNLDFIKTCSYLLDSKTHEIVSDSYYSMENLKDDILNKVLSCKDYAKLLHSVPDSPWSGFYKAEFIKKYNIKFNTLRCANDHSFFIKCVCNARKCMLTDIYLTYYRVNQKNSLISIRSRNFECQIESYNLSSKFILESNFSHEDKMELLKRELNSLFRWYHRIQLDKLSLKKNQKIMQDFVSNYDMTYVGFNYLNHFEFSHDFWGLYFAIDNGIPEISVIVPVYNDEQYVGKCIESIIEQTISNIEIIVINDGSTDKSLAVIRNYAQQDKRIFIINKSNNGAFSARRDGLLNSHGKYVMFVDADDELEPEACRVALNLVMSYRADILQFSTGINNHTGNKLATKWLEQMQDASSAQYTGENILNEIFVKRNITTSLWGKIYLGMLARSAAYHMPNLESSVGEDIVQQFFLSALAQNYKIAKTEPLYWYNYGIGISNIKVMGINKFIQYCQMEKLMHDTKRYISEPDLRNKYEVILYGISKRMCEDCCRIYKNRILNADSLKALYILCMYWGEEAVFRDAFQSVLGINITGKELTKEIKQLVFLSKIASFSTQEELIRIISALKENFKYLNILNDGIFRNNADSPKVSVIIPVYNTEKYLEQCISSIQKQSLKEIEIICVNDGSTDNSLSILNRMASNDERIRIVNKMNGGQSSARNAGVCVSHGSYIYFMDSDDCLDENALFMLYEESEKNKLDIIYFDADSFCDSKEDKCDDMITSKVEWYNKYYKRIKDYSIVRTGENMFEDFHRNNEYRVSPCLQLIYRPFYLLNELNFLEGIIHEDNLFTLRSMLLANRVKHINTILYHRRIRPNSTMTQKESAKNVNGYFNVFLETLKFLERHKISSSCVKYIVKEMETVEVSNIKRIYRNISSQEQLSYLNGLSPINAMLFKQLMFGIEPKVITRNSSNQENLKYQVNMEKVEISYRGINNQISQMDKRLESIEKMLKTPYGIRKMHGCILCYKQHGLLYTLKRFIEHCGIDMGTGDFKK